MGCLLPQARWLLHSVVRKYDVMSNEAPGSRFFLLLLLLGVLCWSVMQLLLQSKETSRITTVYL